MFDTRSARVLAAVLLTGTLQATAQELSLHNPQFRDWDREHGGPAGWFMNLKGYAAEQVCDAAPPAPCAVKLSATASRLSLIHI